MFSFFIHFTVCVIYTMNLTAKVSPSFLYSLFVKTLLFSYLCSIKSQLQPHPITRHNHLFKTTPYLVITQQSILTRHLSFSHLQFLHSSRYLNTLHDLNPCVQNLGTSLFSHVFFIHFLFHIHTKHI